VIVGFGLNGRNVAHAARLAQIPYAILESNPETVLKEKRNGEPIHYGDATMEDVLFLVGLHRARIVVIATSDPIATESIVAQARKINPGLHIIVRTRYVAEIDRLTALGADEVVPEEFSTSLEVFARVLSHYLVPENEIVDMINTLRKEDYAFLREEGKPQLPVHFSDLEVQKIRIGADHPWAGQTLEGIQLRKVHGITVLTIVRQTSRVPNPSAQTEMKPGDVLITIGESGNFRKLPAGIIT
jgi:CPA2 family monovalent cation:H+ antiporter-2